MTQIKSADTARFRAGGWRNYPVLLIFGADEGAVRETASAIVRAAAGPNPDPMNVIQLDGDVIAQDPPRLADELRSFSMFGGDRVVHVRGAGRVPLAVIQAAADEPGTTPLILEAGDLKPGALRTLADKHRNIGALACYSDSARDLQGLIDQVLGAAGLTISREARLALAGALGADRAMSRSELDKLVLYARGEREIDLTMVTEVISDAGRHDTGPLIDHAMIGALDKIEPEANRLFAAGIHPSALLSQTVGHILLLRRARRAADNDPGLTTFKQRNRIHFSRAAALERAAGLWSDARLERALELASDAVLQSRKSARLAEPIGIRALWSIARLVQPAGR